MKKIIPKLASFLKSHKWTLGGGGVILALALIFLLPRIKTTLEGPKAKYETARVKKSDLSMVISASGKIRAENQVTLKFQASGKLAWLGVKEGDWVQKWQAIASLDKRELEKNLKKKLLDYMNERWDFEQTQDDYSVHGQIIEKVTNLTEAEKRILQQAQFDLDSAVLDVEIKDLAQKLATIISPIEGIVTNIDVPIAGVNITPATATFTIADPSQMKFVANVDEEDIGLVRLGQKAIIALDAYSDEELEGTVDKIAFAAITTSGGGTAYPVEIYLPKNENQKYKVGMNGDAEIITEEKSGTLSVPLEAVKEKEGKTYVEIIEKKKIKEIEVETGLSTDTRIETSSGLEEGQEVITKEKKKS